MKALFLNGITSINDYDGIVRLRNFLVNDYTKNEIDSNKFMSVDLEIILKNLDYAADMVICEIFNHLINGIIDYINMTHISDIRISNDINDINFKINKDGNFVNVGLYESLLYRGTLYNIDLDIDYSVQSGWVDIPNIEIIDNELYNFVNKIPKMLMGNSYAHLRNLFLSIYNELAVLKVKKVYIMFINYNVDIESGYDKNVIIGGVEEKDLVKINDGDNCNYTIEQFSEDTYCMLNKMHVEVIKNYPVGSFVLSDESLNVLAGVNENINKH